MPKVSDFLTIEQALSRALEHLSDEDLQATKIKLTLELEKVAVLQAHYDGIIAKELGLDLKKDTPKADANASK